MGTHRLIDIGGCPIQHPWWLNRVIEQVKEVLEELDIPVLQ
ncbi:hypothetical protein VQ056_20930 [Paenibacillus sp. JTLBN-2024]